MHVEESSPCGGVASGERPLLLEREKCGSCKRARVVERVCTPVQARTMNESTLLWRSRRRVRNNTIPGQGEQQRLLRFSSRVVTSGYLNWPASLLIAFFSHKIFELFFPKIARLA